MSRSRSPIVAAWDTETDPFQRGGDPVKPFAWGFYTEEPHADFVSYWGDDCIDQFISFLDGLSHPHLIYAHNGGRFDFLFLLRYLSEDVMVISGRVISCRIGIHELRDSFAILPVSLASTGAKDTIDYGLMRRGVRHRHKKKIIAYMRQDCVALYQQIIAYRARFGNKITMAAAAITKLKDDIEEETGHPEGYTLQRLSEDQDRQFRPFYFGGRVECFERGVILDNLMFIDRISMYPTVMADRQHPTGNRFIRQSAVDDRTDFCIVDATSRGGFPLRAPDKSLTFPHARAVYRITGHEFRAAVSMGKVEVHRLIWAAFSPVRTDFRKFVEKYYALRQAAALDGLATSVLHFKLILNSAYGRFAIDPNKFQDWAIVLNGGVPTPDDWIDGEPRYDPARPWRPAFMGDDVTFWRRDVPEHDRRRGYFNVATGASITGAARADLAVAIWGADRPIYCDTDSLLARGSSVPMDDGSRRLGAWTMEATGTHAFIAGKKLYALADARSDATKEQIAAGKFVTMDKRRVSVVKLASKGVRLTGDEVAAVSRGEVVTWEAEAPTITIAGVQTHMKREIRMRSL